jgi:hypothetical protein
MFTPGMVLCRSAAGSPGARLYAHGRSRTIIRTFSTLQGVGQLSTAVDVAFCNIEFEILLRSSPCREQANGGNLHFEPMRIMRSFSSSSSLSSVLRTS